MSKPLYIHDILDAAQILRDWQPFVATWASDAITRALANVVEYRKTDPHSDRDDTAPVPAYAVKTILSAIRHIESVDRRQSRLEERAAAPRPRFA